MAAGNSLNMDTSGVQTYNASTGDLTASTTTQFDVLVGGANNLISNVGPGSAGQVLQSGGAASNPVYSTPTYPSASGTSGKILISDGTNNIYSTPTYPSAAGTAGNALISDGTNWTSSASFGPSGLTYVTKVLTSAQIKALHATPIQVIASPGAGKLISIVEPVYCKFTYGGSNVFVAGAAQTIKLYYGTTTNLFSATTVLQNAALVSSTSQYQAGHSSISTIYTPNTAAENLAVNLYNDVATEITGNAANDNTISVAFWYYTITL